MDEARRVRTASEIGLGARRSRRTPLPLLVLALCLAAGLLALTLAVPSARAATTGDISGKVSKAGGTGLANIDVSAYQADGYGGWNYVNSVQTASDGSYDLKGFATGSYRVEFRDWSGAYLMQCYNNKATLDLANDVAVTAGATTPNINATLAASGHISGKVSKAGGTGLANIEASAYQPDGSGGWNYVNSVQTASDGSYDLGGLPTGSYRVEFEDWSGAYLMQCYNNKATLDLANDVAVSAGATTPNINATLAASGHISGKVTNAAGTGLADIDVSAYQADGSGDWNYVNDVQTASDGSYDLGGLPTGSYRVEFEDWSGAYLMQCYNNKATLDLANDVAVSAGATTPNINATLATPGHITGKVTNASASGLGRIRVTAYQPDGSGDWNYVNGVQTASDGSYDLGGLPTGSYRVEFEDYSGAYLTQCYNNKATLDLANDVAVSAGATTPNINATLAAAGHISGKVTNASASGLGGIWVTAYQSNGSGGWDYVSDTSSNATSGSYDLGGFATGSYRVEFEDYSGAYLTQCYNNKATLDLANDVAVTAGATTPNINATLAASGHISGKVTNAAGTGLANIDVSAYRANGSGGWHRVNQTTTASGGGYDLKGFATGSYRVEFRDHSGAYLTQCYNNKATLDLANDVAVTAGATTPNINATLAASGHISGKVTNAAGTGLANIDVSAYKPDGSGGWNYVNGTQTVSGGSYDLKGLATGSYRVEFEDWSGDFARQCYNNKATLDLANDVAVTAGATTPNINATLAASGHISGKVTNAAGTGLADIDVSAFQADGSGHWNYVNDVYTASDGSYDLKGFATGSYRVEFEDWSGARLAQYYNNKATLDLANDVAVTAGATTPNINATLAAAGHISGKVTKAGGGALGDVRVTAYQSNGSGGWDRVNDTWSNYGSGSYDLGGLPTGSYRIEFQDWSGVFARQCYNNKATLDLANDVAVSAGATTPNINATLAAAGHISGKVTNASASALGGIWVTAYQADGSGGWDYVSDTTSNATSGSYDLGALPAGSYRVEFSDDAQTYATQFYNNKPTLDLADAVAVTAGASHAGVNATLAAASKLAVTAPTAASRWPSGSTETVTWTMNPAVSVGEFGIGLMSADGSVAVHKQVPAVAGQTSYSTTITASVPAAAGYKVYVEYRPTVGSGGWDPWTVTAAFTVTPVDIPVAPALTGFTPASGPVGTSVTLTGTGLTGATAVAFQGTAATFSVDSDTQIRTTVPAGAITGTISVTTPGGSATSATSFTVTVPAVTPTVTLKLTGLKHGSIKLGKRVTANGVVTPTSLAGSKVTLTLQKKKGAKWVKAKSASALISSTGAFSWKYKPARKGAYRLQAAIPSTTVTTVWRKFKVK